MRRSGACVRVVGRGDGRERQQAAADLAAVQEAAVRLAETVAEATSQGGGQ